VSGGVATFSTTGLTSGVHPITATYSGDSAYFPSTSTITNQIVDPTTTVLVSSNNPSTSGDSVTFTATTTPADSGGNTVTFKDGTTILGTFTTDGSGVATYTTSALGAGVHPITATFEGSTALAPSTSAILNQTVINTACLWISNNSVQTIDFDTSIGWGGDWAPATVLFANPANLDDNSIPAFGSSEGIPATGKTGLSKDAWSYQTDYFATTQTLFGDTSFSYWGASRFVNGSTVIRSTTDNTPYAGFTSTALEISEQGAWRDANLTLKIRNTTGATVTSWNLGLDAWGLGSGGGSTEFRLQVSTDNSSFTDVLTQPVSGDATYTSLGTLSASDVSATVANGDFLYVRYLYSAGGTGNGFAMDNLTIQAVSAGGSPTYASWATDNGITGQPANGDYDNDGLANATEMVLGGNPQNVMNAALAPAMARVTNPAGVPAGNYMEFTFRRSDVSVSSSVGSACEYDADLAGPWTPAVDGVGGVKIIETNDFYGTGIDRVQVYVPVGSNQKLFCRMKVSVP
jgi:hypothetical protein